MKKGILIAGILLFFSSGPVYAQHKYDILPWKSYVSLFQYLMQQVH